MKSASISGRLADGDPSPVYETMKHLVGLFKPATQNSSSSCLTLLIHRKSVKSITLWLYRSRHLAIYQVRIIDFIYDLTYRKTAAILSVEAHLGEVEHCSVANGVSASS